MISETVIYVHDVGIFRTLVQADQLHLLTRLPESKLYFAEDLLPEMNVEEISKMRQFVLTNVFEVQILIEDSRQNGVDSAVDELLWAYLETKETGHRDKYNCPPNIQEILVLWADADPASQNALQFECLARLKLATPVVPEVLTLFAFETRLVAQGLWHSPSNSQRGTIAIDARDGRHDGPITHVESIPADHKQLFNLCELEAMLEKLRLQPGDAKDLLGRNLNRLIKLGASRKFARAPAPARLDELQKRFPNFSEVVAMIQRGIVLRRLTEYPLAHAQPILLLGDPGIGKTAFSKALADAFRTHFFEIRMNGLTAGFTIGGSDISWSNGRPGLLFNEVGLGNFINPIGLLDEVDKVSPDRRYDPLAHLYTLLETDTAKRFQDEAIPLKMDLSHITWIATANDISVIPVPLLSRFTVFEVPAPTPSQARVIIQNIYSGLLANEDWGGHFAPRLSEEVIDVISSVPPRLARKIILDALGCAATENRTEVVASDCRMFSPDLPLSRRIGFY
ncbi:AAA family ATPase [Lacisediminimonas sp.]|uniref:AAA family ATPase n=1 Tax=Lacisediminimonas sp. TaxID=3060582 RepID=UPI002719621B|nr:AAA family ATPase [Lacisediminimonas sp.]MDO8301298.1 AAA family ATPase [Lacisediminimonas sp.]